MTLYFDRIRLSAFLFVCLCARGEVREDLHQPPVSFETNRGQAPGGVRYLSHGSGYWLLLGSADATVALQSQTGSMALKLGWIGGNPNPSIRGKNLLPGKSNYFLGGDPKRWYTDIPNYAQVEYQNVYPGVNLVFYGNQRNFEYDIVLRPGASLESVKLRFTGAKRIAVDANGDLVLYTDAGELHQHKPAVYQNVNGARRELEGRYVISGRNTVQFQVDRYDPLQTLVIDPVLSYSSYFGSSSPNEVLTGMATDSSGNVYLTGTTKAPGFPTTPGSAFPALAAGDCGFVTKLTPQLKTMVYSTYLAGSLPAGIAVDSSGSAYITGSTVFGGVQGNTFTTTPGAYQSPFAFISYGAFITKLNAAGSALVYSALAGGHGIDQATAIAVDPAGIAYITGHTNSTDYPTTPGAFQLNFGGGATDSFVTALSADGKSLVYSSYLGDTSDDSGMGIAVDHFGYAVATGNVHACGNPVPPSCSDGAFLVRVDPTGTLLIYGGLISNSGGFGAAVTVDANGNAFVAGQAGTDLQTTPDALQTQSAAGGAYFGVVDPQGFILYMSYFAGGSASAIALDPSGNVVITGSASRDIALKNPIQSVRTSNFDGFTAKISLPLGAQGLLFGSYFGGRAVAADSNGIVIAGPANENAFPITSDAVQTQHINNFVARISDSGSCNYGAALASQQAIAGSGGTATINVTASAGCQWTANSDDTAVLTIASGSSGTGNGTVTVTVAASTLIVSRTSNVTVAGQVVTITQLPGATCSFSLDPTSATFPPEGGSGLIKITGGSQQCFWSATTGVSWIHLQYVGGQGTDLPYTVQASTGAPRMAAINVSGQTFTVTQTGSSSPSIGVSRDTLYFTSDGTHVSGPQTFDLTFSNLPNASWSLFSASFVMTPSSGAGNATIRVTVNNFVGDPIRIDAPGAANSPFFVQTRTTRVASGPPFGSFDTPINNSTGIVGAIPVTGWALDNVEVAKVDIWREPVGAEPAGLVYIGDAVFVVGARPDVEAANPRVPFNYRAGWGYALLTNFLPGGNGVFKLHAIAHNSAGTATDLGTRVITVDNAHAAKPFGTIDTPGQGGTASGSAYLNFGWALTQNPYMIPTDGSTITAYVDGVPVGHPTYNQYRSDIANLFPGLANSGGAVGFFYLDTTKLTNGVHTISWNVFDNQGRGEGIGSRYFNVLNSGTAAALEETATRSLSRDEVTLRSGYDLDRPAEALTPARNGEYSIDMEQLGRIELQVGATRGYALVNGRRRALPVGSTLKDGSFYWQAGPGFLGEFQLVFERAGQDRPILVRVRIRPQKLFRQEAIEPLDGARE